MDAYRVEGAVTIQARSEQHDDEPARLTIINRLKPKRHADNATTDEPVRAAVTLLRFARSRANKPRSHTCEIGGTNNVEQPNAPSHHARRDVSRMRIVTALAAGRFRLLVAGSVHQHGAARRVQGACGWTRLRSCLDACVFGPVRGLLRPLLQHVLMRTLQAQRPLRMTTARALAFARVNALGDGNSDCMVRASPARS